MSNQSASTDQSLNTSIQNQSYFPYNNNNNNNNIYYYNNPKRIIKNTKETPKIIQNKLIPQKESVYSIYHQNKNIPKNTEILSNIKKQFIDDSSFYSQKPVQTFELNLNVNNNINKMNNIVNIDNQSSAFELCFFGKKKTKKNFKITTLYQIGPKQKPLSLSFISEKGNKNINSINNNIINESNITNTSFVSNRQIENNSFAENEINYLNNISNKKNELKIMQNPLRKNETKPKPVLQIMSSGGNNNKSNYSKKLSESNIPQVNGFSLEENNNNDLLKNNFGYISKSASMIVNNNNNQDMSFISNSKETENLLEINENYNYNKNNNFGFFGIENNNNAYNGYLMTNNQICFPSEKNNKNINAINISNISNISMNNSINKTNAKKYIKIEYYDIQPVYFEILSEINSEVNMSFKNSINTNKINDMLSYKMYRVEEMQFIKENKDNEEKSFEKEENKSFNNNNININNNNNNTKKKRRKRKKK